MKRALILSVGLLGFIVFQAYSQCEKTHYFCASLLDKDKQAEFWNLNNQSKSATFEKGKVYKMSFVAYQGFDYRISVCTDVVEGGDKVRFELFHDAIIRVKDEYGNTNIQRKKESLYSNQDDNLSPMVEFTVDKTKKFYIDVNVPVSGESKDRKLSKTDNVCVGVLLEHKKAAKLGF